MTTKKRSCKRNEERERERTRGNKEKTKLLKTWLQKSASNVICDNNKENDAKIRITGNYPEK